MKKSIVTTLLTLVSLASAAQDGICLNGKWQFRYAKDAATADALVADGFYRADYAAEGFDTITVPSNWAVLGYEEPVYRHFAEGQDSEGLYLRRFTVPASLEGRRILLHFGGIWSSAEVWLNGLWIGRHDSGFTSFAIDVSKHVKAGQENVLAVRVRQVYPGHETDTYDDWSLGGIYRDVTLEAMPAKRRIDRVEVTTRMTGDVDVRVMVADEHKNTLPGNYLSPGRPYRLRLALTDSEGRTVAERTVDVAAHTSHTRETRELLRVDGPNLWTAETPYLYTLRVELLEDGQPTHVRRQKIGIREISTADGVLRINGQKVTLRGVNRHDEHPDVGRATTREHWLQDLRLMKEANINYIRAAHYQHAKGFIEMCDSIGMYVGAEVSLGGANTRMYDPGYASAALLRCYETVTRDQGNPSIIYWSVGNEDSFKDMLLQCVRTVKGLDPSRPVLLPWNAYEMLPEEVDILAPHYWTSHEYDSIARITRRPIITTEYVHAYGLQRFGGLDECFRALTAHPAGAGGAVWMWADQGLRTPTRKDRTKYGSLAKDDDYLRLDGNGWDGITDSYRRPTQDYWETKAVYCPTLPATDHVSLSPTLQIPIHNGYDFTDLSTVTIGWQLFVDGRQKAQGTARLTARPHETAMLAVPTTRLGKVKAGETAYLWLTFTDASGHEMGRRAVEIETDAARRIGGKPSALAVNPATGLPEGFSFTIWHRFNDGDQIIRHEEGFEKGDTARFEAKAHTTQNADGSLTVDYEITPLARTRYVPLIGLSMKMKSSRSLRQWLGKGPDEAWPNKQTAPLFGLWNAQGMSGTNRMRWADIDNLRIYCDGYLDRDTANSGEVRFLSHVLGRSEKGRLNYPEYRLEPGKTYKGSITIVTK